MFKILALLSTFSLSLTAHSAVVLNSFTVEYDDGSMLTLAFDATEYVEGASYNLGMSSVSVSSLSVSSGPTPSPAEFYRLSVDLSVGTDNFAVVGGLDARADRVGFPALDTITEINWFFEDSSADWAQSCETFLDDIDFCSSYEDFGFTGGGVAELTYEVVSQVPVPASAWLFMSALIGLVGKKRLARR